LSLRQIRIFEISIKFSIFDAQYNLFEKNHFQLSEGQIYQILGHKTPIKEETAQNIENYLF
jgi:hypothetical protein